MGASVPEINNGVEKSGRKILLLVVLLLAAFLLLTFAIHRAFSNNTPGIDFYVYWQAGRAFFFERQDPYSPEISAQIQQGIYGREALPNEDPMHFANPAYSLLAVLPWLLLPFGWAQAAWMAFNLLVLVSLLFSAFPKAPRWVLLLLPFFYPMTFGLILGNFAVLVFGILAASFSLVFREAPMKQGALVLLGVLLAWLTVKPQSVWLFLAVLLAAAYRRKLYALLAGFAASLGMQLGISLLVMPDWPLRWLERVLNYAGYSNYQPSRLFYLDLLLPPEAVNTASILVSGALILVVLFFTVRWWRGRTPLLILLSWCGLTMYFSHPNSLSYEQLILLLPPLLWATAQKKSSRSLIFFWLGGWIFSYVVLFASWRLDVGWPVLHLPLAAYLVWMAWLHIWRLPRWKKDEQGTFL